MHKVEERASDVPSLSLTSSSEVNVVSLSPAYNEYDIAWHVVKVNFKVI